MATSSVPCMSINHRKITLKMNFAGGAGVAVQFLFAWNVLSRASFPLHISYICVESSSHKVQMLPSALQVRSQNTNMQNPFTLLLLMRSRWVASQSAILCITINKCVWYAPAQGSKDHVGCRPGLTSIAWTGQGPL